MKRQSSTNYQGQARSFIAPGLALAIIVLHLPVVYTLYLSFTKYNGLGSPGFIGMTNYVKMFSEPIFLVSLGNTLIWVVGSIVLPVGLGLLVAYLAFGLKGGAWLRLPFLVPFALSGVAVGVVWSFMLGTDGALTQALQFLHLPGSELRWLQDAPLNTIVMVIASAWHGVGVNALIFTVGLQSIPQEPFEAARLDGATGWKMFRHIVWPLLAPSTTVVVGLAIVGGLKTFDIVQSMTQGGPARASETLALTMYRETFVNSDYGLGAAVAMFLSLVTVAASVIYLRRQLSLGDTTPRRSK
ncbi:carbohydrate ABC transporter permease [Pseudarthrobacter sp. SSS035]|uniref:carbohydrate ABC transporter permease n=1 Tax=Pseudarthrobacter sp. SSS035 TaxID=2931399 RepID=UPI00200BA8C6|nr:sugar ABC transporter permease [Pseudarthrobacter sp. SSS035]